MTGDRVEIVPLADRPNLIPVVGRWHWDEWGAGAPDVSLEAWIEALRAKCGRDRTPITWVGLLDGMPAGSVAVIKHDMPNHRDLTPWLSAVFVAPAFRGRGVGSRLVEHGEREARRLGYTRLFLYTDLAESLYARRGWEVIGREVYDRSLKAIMARDLVVAADAP